MGRQQRPPLPTLPPKVMQQIARELSDTTGHTPEVEQAGQGVWRLTITNDRVRMTVDYKSNGRGGYRWHDSHLWIDGKERQRARNSDHFVQIFLNPDLGLDPRDRAPAEPAAMPPARDADEAPSEVRAVYDDMRKRIGDHDNIHIGYGGGAWVIGLGGDRGTLRFRWVRGRHGRWHPDPDGFIQVIVDGVDRSTEAEGNLTKAFSLMGGQPDTEAPSTSPAGAPSKGPRTRANSVTVRNTTVIRV